MLQKIAIYRDFFLKREKIRLHIAHSQKYVLSESYLRIVRKDHYYQIIDFSPSANFLLILNPHPMYNIYIVIYLMYKVILYIYIYIVCDKNDM